MDQASGFVVPRRHGKSRLALVPELEAGEVPGVVAEMKNRSNRNHSSTPSQKKRMWTRAPTLSCPYVDD